MITKKSKGFTQHHFLGSGINKNVSSNASKKFKSGAGFTIIELLVVVAIIAVLAAIVLVNVTGYINKGKDASIKGNLSTTLVQSAVYYDTNGNYGTTAANGLCATPIVANALAAANTASGVVGGATCTYNVTMPATATAFCACSPEKTTGNVYCVDSTGNKKESASTCAAACPSTGACL